MIHHQIGSPITVDGEIYIQTMKDKAGMVVYGPYELYQPGIYSVTFNIMPDGYNPGAGVICGWAEVTASLGKIVLERTNLFIDRLLRDEGRVVLNVELSEAAELEFRVYSTGKRSLKVSTAIAASPIPAKGYCPVLTPDMHPTDDFFCNNFQHFRNLYENGGQVRLTGQGAIATCADISFYLRSVEDFQLTTEIFFFNEYNFDLRESALAIDVGMNVGLTSLHMAKNPRVAEVYGFEPFRKPFARALENFSLNPAVSEKIKPLNIGLSGTNKQLTLLVDGNSTIGTSIKGHQTGDTEIITVRNAADIFDELISRAKSNGWAVIAKIDCEGSEFAIIEALSAAGLLKHIRLLMVEWHKWWSSDKSQRDIVQPLLEESFVIFDRTMPANPHAGMLYAVHSGQSQLPNPRARRWWQRSTTPIAQLMSGDSSTAQVLRRGNEAKS